VNEAAEVIHGVTHPDANIIFGSIIDDEMGDEVRITVIAAGFDRWDDGDPHTSSAASSLSTPSGSGAPSPAAPSNPFASASPPPTPRPSSASALDDINLLASSSTSDLDDLDSEDEFDVPSFLK
jgi:cell division protein FtsZ